MKTQIINAVASIVVKLTDEELKDIHLGTKLYRTKYFQAANEEVGENSQITVHLIVSKQES